MKRILLCNDKLLPPKFAAIMESAFFCKCSICFENDSETELLNCGDQYCLECLERYVEFWIRESSWGIQPVKLGCPVCGAEVVSDDWMPFVSDELLQAWRRFEQKRVALLKTFQLARTCPTCTFAQPIIGLPIELSCAVDAFHQCGGLLAALLDALPGLNASWRTLFHLEIALDLMHELASGELIDEEGWLETVEELWRDFLSLIQKSLKLNPDEVMIDTLMRFGRLFLRLFSLAVEAVHVDIPGSRSILLSAQLDFQLSFPFCRCDCCGAAFCLPCRRVGWHTSHPHMSNSPSSKLRQCPRCFVPVIKDPEGCNEICCNFCGFKFCWECGRRWTSACGIYKCQSVEDEGEDDFEDALDEEYFEGERAPEHGVPNVRELEKRLLTRL